jgi:hypothetical protein
VTIDVPPQVVSRTLELTASSPGSVPANGGPNLTVIRAVMQLQVTSGGVAVTQFDPALTVNVQYTVADLQPVGGDPNKLKLFAYDGSRWSDFPNPQVNATTKTLTIELRSRLGSQDVLGIAY